MIYLCTCTVRVLVYLSPEDLISMLNGVKGDQFDVRRSNSPHGLARAIWSPTGSDIVPFGDLCVMGYLPAVIWRNTCNYTRLKKSVPDLYPYQRVLYQDATCCHERRAVLNCAPGLQVGVGERLFIWASRLVATAIKVDITSASFPLKGDEIDLPLIRSDKVR